MIGFNWIVAGKVAGSPQPGLYGDWDEQIEYLKRKKIDYVFSLTEEPLIEEEIKQENLHFMHLAIRDMDAPMPRHAYAVLKTMKEAIDAGHVFLLHCKGGVGRTGMIAACYLVMDGYPAREAISKVRSIHSAYIQTKVQENFVSHYETYLRKQS
ncbi:MAG: dual specificity protein phosphatase family protein [Bacteroidota bacterium]